MGLQSSATYDKQIKEKEKLIKSLEQEIDTKTKQLPSATDKIKQQLQEDITVAKYAITSIKSELQQLNYMKTVAKQQEDGKVDKNGNPTDGSSNTITSPAEEMIKKGQANTNGEILIPTEKPTEAEKKEEDCGCKDEGKQEDANTGEIVELKPSYIIPQLNSKGVFTFLPPFDKEMYNNKEYTVKALRLVKEIYDAEEDPFLNIYEANGLIEADFERDLKWKIPVVVFATDADQYYYVPATYIGSLPKELNGYKYRQYIMGVNLGMLPTDFNLDLVKENILENLKAACGITSCVEVIEASDEETVPAEEHDKFLRAVEATKTDTNSPAVRIKFLQEKYLLLQEQLKIMSNCFHYHVEHKLALMDKTQTDKLGYTTPTPPRPKPDPNELAYTEKEYLELQHKYHTVEFWYKMSNTRFGSLKGDKDSLERDKAELIETVATRDSTIEHLRETHEREANLAKKRVDAERLFERYWYIEIPAEEPSANNPEGKPAERFYGAVQFTVQDGQGAGTTYMLGKRVVMCKDCLRYIPDLIPYINTATAMAITNKDKQINYVVDNTNRTEKKLNPATGKEEVVKLPPVVITPQEYEFDIKSIDGIPNLEVEDFSQPGQPVTANHITLETNSGEYKQYCKHIPPKWWGKPITFDSSLYRPQVAGVGNLGREYGLHVWKTEIDFKVSAILKAQLRKFFNAAIQHLEKNAIDNGLVMNKEKGTAIYQNVDLQANDDQYRDEGEALLDVKGSNCHMYYLRTMVAAIRLFRWCLGSLELIVQNAFVAGHPANWCGVLTYLAKVDVELMCKYADKAATENPSWIQKGTERDIIREPDQVYAPGKKEYLENWKKEQDKKKAAAEEAGEEFTPEDPPEKSFSMISEVKTIHEQNYYNLTGYNTAPAYWHLAVHLRTIWEFLKTPNMEQDDAYLDSYISSGLVTQINTGW